MTLTLSEPESRCRNVVKSSPQHPSDLISQLLREQSSLTAVEEFSEWKSSHTDAATYTEPEQAKYYRHLLPLQMPQAGQQLGFEVDLDRCSGCKACVVACHSLNGLDEGESFRDVGLLLGATTPSGGQSGGFQHVTTACHHCVDPGCLSACPVNAYEKDPVTGIVRHLDDQCFGCQYCTLACPYEVPKFHAAKGIVRKCDMCSQRLAVGEAPACVQACPHQAISIRTIELSDARTAAETMNFLPDSPNPQITIPTTRYVGRAATSSDLRAGLYAVASPEPAHVPLVILLVFSQWSVGLTVIVWLLQSFPGIRMNSTVLLTTAFVTGAFAVISSTLHLGRPQYAFRAFLGIRHSWLSREIVAFGLCILMTGVAAGLSAMGSPLMFWSLTAAVISGVLGVAASVMIYHVTHRPFWNAGRSAPSFVLTSVGLSSMTTWLALQTSAEGTFGTTDLTLLRGLAGLAFACGLMRLTLLKRAVSDSANVSQVSGDSLRDVVWSQAFLGSVFSLACGAVLLRPAHEAAGLVAAIGLAAGLVTELTERSLFFRAVVPLRMPGVVRS
jgi:formate dehydrogenase iron-sulfur subunit